MARKTKEGAEETRASILQAALSLFSSRGVTGTTLTDVAQKAGVTRGAIYWHFDNKEDVLRALRDEAVLPYQQLAESGLRMDEPDPLGKLQVMLRRILTDVAENPATRQVFQIWLDRGKLGSEDRNEINTEEEKRRVEVIQRTENILRNAVRKGQLAADFDVKLGAVAVFTFIDGMVMAMLLAPASSNIKDDIIRITDAFFYMLRAGNNPYLTTAAKPEQLPCNGSV